MTDPRANDPVDDLLAVCLQADDPATAVAIAVSTHPDYAAALRARWEFLVAADAPIGRPAGAIGSRLGRFRLIEKVGGGGMGVVYRAFEEPPGREVALKLVRPEQLWFAGAHKRFLREVETVAAMQHPGIVPVYSCGDHDGVPFCAMEYVRGRSLADVLAALRREGAAPAPAALRQGGARTWSEACARVVVQVAEALAYVHGRGVVHRDVKPSNVLLDDAGRARLIDFGLARAVGGDSLTRTGVQPGSLAYMSPEQVRGDEVDQRTDVWSLGVTLYELLTVRQPFLADTEEATRRAILAGVAPSPAAARPARDLATIAATAMAPERDRRYPSMAAFAADLLAYLKLRPIAARPPGPLLRMQRWVQRHPAAAALLALVFTLFGVLPTVLLLREHAAAAEIGKEAARARAAELASAREAATARRVLEFMQELFHEVDPARARGATVPARVILDRGVQRIRTELQDEPVARAALLRSMGVVYLNLGLVAESEDLLRECRRVCEQELHLGGAALHELRVDLAQVAAAKGRHADAERLLRDVLAEQSDAAERAATTVSLARHVWRQDRDQEALQLYDQALATLQARGADDPAVLDARRQRAQLLLWRMDPARALHELRDLCRRMRRTLRADDVRLLRVTHDLAVAEIENGNPGAAEATLREIELLAARIYDDHHPALAHIRETLAQAQTQLDRPQAALSVLDRALAAYQASFPEPHYVLARVRNLESNAAIDAGDLPRAERAARAALRAFEQLFPDGSQDEAVALCSMSHVLLLLGSIGEAERVARAGVEMQDRFTVGRHDIAAHSRAQFALALAHAGKIDEAVEQVAAARELLGKCRDARHRAFVSCHCAEVLLLARKHEQGLQLARAAAEDWRAFGSANGADWADYVQGWAQNELGNLAEAEQLLRATLGRQRERLPHKHPIVGRTAGELGVVLARQDRLPEALALLQESVATMRDYGRPDNPRLALPLLNLASARAKHGDLAAAATLGLEVLDNLRTNGAKGSRFVEPTLRLLLRALPAVADGEARSKAWATLRLGAGELLPADHGLLAEIAAAGGR